MRDEAQNLVGDSRCSSKFQQAAAAKGCITAATCQITLKILTACWMLPIFFIGSENALQNCPFPRPHLIYVPWTRPSPYLARYLDQFIRFCRADGGDQQTDTQTTLLRWQIGHLLAVLCMWCNLTRWESTSLQVICRFVWVIVVNVVVGVGM